MLGSSLPPVVLFTLFVFVYVVWCSTHIVLCFCFVFFVLCIPQALVARTTPLFLTFCLQIYFQLNFFISLLFHLFFLILTCSCQYSYNLMSTSNCMCRPYTGADPGGAHPARPPPPKIGEKKIFWRKIPQKFSRLPPLGAIF